MWVIVGLGNPGADYAHTRHNAGFMVVETIARRWSIALRDDGVALRIGHGRVAGQSVLLMEPRMFMNLSGEAIAQCQRKPDDPLLVVYDDLDLPPGQIRVRRRGGSGGHRGVASIVAHHGAEFARVRVGIGRPLERRDAAEHVLAPLSAAQLVAMRTDVERAADAVECVIVHGPHVAMSRFNGPPLPGTE
jgi:peptidyl-tRNA hydrolase, PTH1 family